MVNTVRYAFTFELYKLLNHSILRIKKPCSKGFYREVRINDFIQR